MSDDECNTMTVIAGHRTNADIALCCLPPGHSGPHWDQLEGWEW